MTAVDLQLEEMRRRISALEEENRALKTARSGDTNMVMTPTPQPEPEGIVRIYSTGLIAPAWILPSVDERDALKELVFAQYPGLKPTGRFADLDISEFDRGFEIAMHWLAVKGRGPLDTKHALSWWVDDANNNWCREAKLNPSVTGASLLAACLAWGDVDFALPLGNQIGLTPYGWCEPKEATWRKVLSAGRLRSPLQPVRPQTVAPSTVRIDGQQRYMHQTW